VFGEGLTLAGARRRLEAALPRPAAETQSDLDEVLDTLGADARTRIEIVRGGLRSILEVLSRRAGAMPVPELPQNGASEPARRAPAGRGQGRPASSRPAPARTAKRVAASKRRHTEPKGRGKRKRASA